jgi:preprotein translocase subunit SecE
MASVYQPSICYNYAMDHKKAAQANPRFASDLMSELRKVTWPTRQETLRLTIVVIAISLIIGLYIGIIDVLLAKGLEIITK